jgi:osmotically-inducible protein OsmY
MRMSGWIAAAILGLGMVGCSKEAADNAGDKLSQGTEQAGKAAENAVTTGKIRSAIETANDVKIEGLNVDTIDKKVVLKGKALDAKSKDTAEQIAKTQVGNDYSVVNEITIGS